ncbi:MAG TPA: cyclase family protein [Acidimicrobiales bacterium]|nr:cyclase family protein [Acidimicrobiales bacterium]
MPRAPLRASDVSALHHELSNWGRWGGDDELGAINLITPEVTVRAAALASTGRTVSCARSLPTQPAADNPNPVAHHMIGTASEGFGADYFAVAPHGFATSHIDALCHIFFDGQMYNGYDEAAVTPHGATRLGIHFLQAGIVTRGVLVDVPALRGVEALEPGEPIFPEDLERAEESAGTTVQSGDALLVRTGRWRWRAEHGPWPIEEGLAGLDASCLRWLSDRDVAVLGSDGVSDVLPSRVEGVAMPIHTVAIVAMGVHLLDNLDLDQLAVACAEEHRWEFLLTVAPLVLFRGTASPVNPIAVF